MFPSFRRVHKVRFVRLLCTALVLSTLMVCWEDLDHHMFSHVKSFTFRYLVNKYDFLNSSFSVDSNHQSRKDGANAGTFQYLMNHPGKCGGADGGGKSPEVLLLLFVKSSPENFGRRQAIRATWGNETYLWSELRANVKVVFVLGLHPDVNLRAEHQLSLEDQVYRDLVQQNFEDTFHNLTAKLVLQFHWFHRFCPRARFVMSADDDIFVHTPNLVRYLQELLSSQTGATDLWVGHVHRGSPPIRRKSSKYYVPYHLYPWLSYPDYTAGAGYVVSGGVAEKIYRATLLLKPSIYIDDVFMGICAKTMGVSPQGNGDFSGEGKLRSHPCIYDHMITSHGHAGEMLSLWATATDPAVHRKHRGFLGNLYCAAVRMMLM